jgi:hypothetical protein
MNLIYAWAIAQAILFFWFMAACIHAWAEKHFEHPEDRRMRILRVHGRVAPMADQMGFMAGYLACERGEQ